MAITANTGSVYSRVGEFQSSGIFTAIIADYTGQNINNNLINTDRINHGT